MVIVRNVTLSYNMIIVYELGGGFSINDAQIEAYFASVAQPEPATLICKVSNSIHKWWDRVHPFSFSERRGRWDNIMSGNSLLPIGPDGRIIILPERQRLARIDRRRQAFAM